MKKTIFSIIALLLALNADLMANTIDNTINDIREQNYPVYVLLGTFDIIAPNRDRLDDWGRAHKPRVPRVDDQGRALRPEFEYSDALLDAIYDGLALGRRTMTRDIQSRTELKQFLNSQDEETYALEGTILKMESATKFSNSINKHREISSIDATVRVRFELVDLRTNEVISTFELERSGTSTYRPSIEEALDKAFNSMTRGIKFKLNDLFPSYGNVTKIGETTDKKVETLYIDLGTDDRIEPGNHFEVKQLTISKGKEVYKKVGKVKVLDEQGPASSKCKVVSNGAKILSALKDGSTLIIESYNGFWE